MQGHIYVTFSLKCAYKNSATLVISLSSKLLSLFIYHNQSNIGIFFSYIISEATKAAAGSVQQSSFNFSAPGGDHFLPSLAAVV